MQHYTLIHSVLQFLPRHVGKLSSTFIHVTNGNYIFFKENYPIFKNKENSALIAYPGCFIKCMAGKFETRFNTIQHNWQS